MYTIKKASDNEWTQCNWSQKIYTENPKVSIETLANSTAGSKY